MAIRLPLASILLTTRLIIGVERPDDGYRLLDGHYVGRVGCDRRGDLHSVAQPVGNLSLPECKARCDAQSACRGISFLRGGNVRWTLRRNTPRTK